MISWADASLLAFALSSKIVIAALSSMYRGADSRSDTFTFNCCHSWSASLPVLNLSDERPVSAEISLVISHVCSGLEFPPIDYLTIDYLYS